MIRAGLHACHTRRSAGTYGGPLVSLKPERTVGAFYTECENLNSCNRSGYKSWVALDQLLRFNITKVLHTTTTSPTASTERYRLEEQNKF